MATYSLFDAGACNCVANLACGEFCLPETGLTVTYTSTYTIGSGSQTLAFLGAFASPYQWRSVCIPYGADYCYFGLTCSSSGGPVPLFSFYYNLSLSNCNASATSGFGFSHAPPIYTANPFSLSWPGAISGTSFTALAISAPVNTGCPEIYVCGPCTAPFGVPAVLSLSVASSTVFPGGLIVPMPYLGSGLWQSACVGSGGLYYTFVYQCVSGTMVFTINQYAAAGCTGSPVVVTPALNSYNCAIFAIAYKTTISSPLGVGTYTFTS